MPRFHSGVWRSQCRRMGDDALGQRAHRIQGQAMGPLRAKSLCPCCLEFNPVMLMYGRKNKNLALPLSLPVSPEK